MKFAIICASVLISSAALAEDMSTAEFFARDKEHKWTGQLTGFSSPYGSLQPVRPMPASKQAIANKIVQIVQERIGGEWSETALRLAKIESGYNCSATGPRVRGGRARGILQVMPKSAVALGYDPARLHECEYGIRAGVEHMKACIDSGVKTPKQMAACHVAGVLGWNRRLSYKAEKYKRYYIQLAMR